jgi:DNA replication protein DnaC
MVDENKTSSSGGSLPVSLAELLEKGKRFAEANSLQPRACFDCGKTIPAGRLCDVCGAARAEAARIAEAMDSIPDMFRWATFASPDLVSRVTNPRAIAQSRSLRDFGRVVFVGPTGTGKTSLAIATLRDRVENTPGARCFFISAWQLGRALAQLDESESGEVVRALKCPLLVLDDVGSERHLPSNPVPDIIAERHQSNRATWVTTWMNGAQVADRYGGGIARRIFEQTAIVDCG